MMRALRLLAVAAAVALAVPAAAGAYQRVDYAVTIAGTAEYNAVDVDRDETGESSLHQDYAWSFRTEIPRLSFHGDVAEDSAGAVATATATRGSLAIHAPNGVTMRCTGATVIGSDGGGLDATRAAGGTRFATRVLTGVRLEVAPCQSPLYPFELPIGSAGRPVGEGPFDAVIEFPHADIGRPLVVFPLAARITDDGCPWKLSTTVLCSLTWSASVEFRRIGEAEVPDDDDGIFVPLPAAPVAAPPPVPAAPAPTIRGATLARTGAKAVVSVLCPAACRGTVSARAGKRKPLARAAFRAEAGMRSRVVLRFGRAARRRILRAGGVRLVVTARHGRGAVVRRTTAVRLRR